MLLPNIFLVTNQQDFMLMHMFQHRVSLWNNDIASMNMEKRTISITIDIVHRPGLSSIEHRITWEREPMLNNDMWLKRKSKRSQSRRSIWNNNRELREKRNFRFFLCVRKGVFLKIFACFDSMKKIHEMMFELQSLSIFKKINERNGIFMRFALHRQIQYGQKRNCSFYLRSAKFSTSNIVSTSLIGMKIRKFLIDSRSNCFLRIPAGRFKHDFHRNFLENCSNHLQKKNVWMKMLNMKSIDLLIISFLRMISSVRFEFLDGLKLKIEITWIRVKIAVWCRGQIL